MAVLGRLLLASGERLDLADILSIDSYTAGDFKYLLQGLIGNSNPLILKGFEVINPGIALGTQNISIGIADSVVFYPTSLAGPFYVGLPQGNINAQPLVPELVQNATNYVYLTFTTFDTSKDSRAFWDPDLNGGLGGEFTQDINTESALAVQVGVSTSSFPDNTIPICQVVMGTTIISIEDCREMMFRLGTGGLAPNPFNRFTWPSLPSTPFQRVETPGTLSSGTQPNPFEGGDKNITNLKQWMDAIMSKIAELGGTTYWYDDISTFNIVNTFMDFNTVLQSIGIWTHSATIPGHVSWSADINIKSAADPRTYVLQGPGFVQLANNQVAYLNLGRNQPINISGLPVAFINGQAYINTISAEVGLFANLNIGDYVRNVNDPNQNYVQVVQFYDSPNALGLVTTPALALSISVSAPYAGPTMNELATFDSGVYTSADLIVANRFDASVTTAGGNFFWLAFRSDNIESLTNIATTSLSITISTNDGNRALVTSTTVHGLSDNQRVTIAGTADYNGIYQVEVASTTTFYIPQTAIQAVPESGTASYATVTTTSINGFPTDSSVNITGTINFNTLPNQPVQIAVIDPNHFQIPVAAGGGSSDPYLASAASFGILAKSAITNSVGTSTVNGDLGESPGGTETGAITVTGATHLADGTAATAQVDANNAYVTIAALTGYTTIANDLGTVGILSAGRYTFASGSVHLATSGPQTLTLNGSATDVFIFKTPSTLDTGAGGTPTITLTGGALPQNVYWVVGSAANINIGTAGTFQGTILAASAIIVTMGGTVNGRLIATTASGTAITLSLPTTINVPGGGVTPPETVGTITLAAVIVRTQTGPFTLYQGQSVPINGTFSTIALPPFINAPVDYAIPPGYNTLAGTENYNSSPTDGIVVRLSELTGMMADKAQDKTIKYLPSGLTTITNTTSGPAQLITFQGPGATLTILQPGSPGNAVVALPSAGGISLLINQSAYVVIDRNAPSTPAIVVADTSAVPIGENVFVIAARLADTSIYIWDGFHVIAGATLPYPSSGSGLFKVRLYDPVSATLPTGNPVTIDGVSVNAGDLVLFSNLGSGNNKIYKAVGTGTNITSWITQAVFNGSSSPSSGDTVVVQAGTAFADTIGIFDGTTWNFNNKVRYFNGVDYWEVSALNSVALANNQVSPTDIFSIAWAGSQNIIVDYSILRGTTKETGTITLTTDGVTVGIATTNVDLAVSAGITFSAIVSGANIHLQYTSTNTGVAGQIKFILRRWSDAAGGPGGIPSYTGGGGGAGVTTLNGLSGAVTLTAGANITLTPSGSNITIDATAASSSGVAGAVQFSDGAGGFSSDDPDFHWDNTNKRLGIGINTPSSPVHSFSSAASSSAEILAENSLSTHYAMIAMKASAREYRVGTGGSAESSFGVADKFFVYDVNATSMRLIIDTAGLVTLTTGLSTPTFQMTTSPTAGYVLTSDAAGNGTWVIGGGSGANTALSNLVATTVNQSLNPGVTDGSLGLGTITNYWGVSQINGLNDATGVLSVDPYGRVLQDATSIPSLEWQTRQLFSASNTANVDWSSNALIKILGDGTGSGRIQLNRFANDFSMTIQANDSMAGDLSWTLPVNAGTSGYILSTDGAGNLSWITPTGGSGAIINYAKLLTIAPSDGDITVSSPGDGFDGVSFVLTAGDLIYLSAQTIATENGLWIWNGAAVPLTRPVGWTNGSVIPAGTMLSIYGNYAGQIHGGTLWLITATNKTVGTDDLMLVSQLGFNPAQVGVDIIPSSMHVISIGSNAKSIQTVWAAELTNNGPLDVHASKVLISGDGVVAGLSVEITNASDTGSIGGQIQIQTGTENGGNEVSSGVVAISTGAADSGASGAVVIGTGTSDDTTALGINDHGSGALQFQTGAGISGSYSGPITLTTGDAAAAGNSGDIRLTIGASTGTVGKIVLNDASGTITAGQVWTSISTDGSGHWAAAGGIFNPLANNVALQWLDNGAVARNIVNLNASNIIQVGDGATPINISGSRIDTMRMITGNDTLSATTDFKVVVTNNVSTITLNLPQGVQGLSFIIGTSTSSAGLTLVPFAGDSIDGIVTMQMGTLAATLITYDLASTTWYNV